MSNIVRLTENEFRGMVEKIRNGSVDPDVVKQLEDFATETDINIHSKAEPDMEYELDELRRQSPISEGECPICGNGGTLISGVCDSCFKTWASSVVREKRRG